MDITESDELDRAEASWIASQLAQLYRRDGLRIEGSYDQSHLQASTGFCSGRSITGPDRSAQSPSPKADLFCRPQFVEPDASDVFGRLARANHLQSVNRSDFLDGLAEAIGDVNAVHPFREGNGRTQRAFVSQLARDAGHPLDWQGLDAEQNLIASRRSL